MPGWRWMWVGVVTAALAVPVAAQEGDVTSPYFECPYINYFDSDCPQAQRDEARMAAPGDEGEEEPQDAEDRESDHEWMEEVPEELLPLFPRESLAPDTPSLFHLLLMRPTLANARRYVRWHARRMSRIREVQGLMDVAGREFLAGKAGER